MRTRSIRRLAGAALAFTLVLGACGDDDAGSDGPEAGADTGDGVAPDRSSLDLAALDAEVEIEDGHSTDHVDGPVDYDRSPPSGGDHASRWLTCGVYDEPVPTENAVHSLEHGAVWFAYDPDLPADDVAKIEALAEIAPDKILVSPFPGIEADVVAVAWGRRLVADGADDVHLGPFAVAFVGGDQAPEPNAPCRGGITP